MEMQEMIREWADEIGLPDDGGVFRDRLEQLAELVEQGSLSESELAEELKQLRERVEDADWAELDAGRD